MLITVVYQCSGQHDQAEEIDSSLDSPTAFVRLVFRTIEPNYHSCVFQRHRAKGMYNVSFDTDICIDRQ